MTRPSTRGPGNFEDDVQTAVTRSKPSALRKRYYDCFWRVPDPQWLI
jgi:hypothetical protein